MRLISEELDRASERFKKAMETEWKPVAIISSYLYYWPTKGKYKNRKELGKYFEGKKTSEKFRKAMEEGWRKIQASKFIW